MWVAHSVLVGSARLGSARLGGNESSRPPAERAHFIPRHTTSSKVNEQNLHDLTREFSHKTNLPPLNVYGKHCMEVLTNRVTVRQSVSQSVCLSGQPSVTLVHNTGRQCTMQAGGAQRSPVPMK